MNEEPSPPITIGETLKYRRIALGRSIEQMAATTRIHSKIITSIENDHYLDLPARAFTRGFLVSYAKALGLPGEKLVQEHHEFLEKKFQERPNKEKGHEGYVFESKELEQNKRWMIIGSVSFIIILAVVFLFFKPQNHKRKEKHKEFTEDAIASGTIKEDEFNGAEGLPLASPTSSIPPAPAVNLIATSPAETKAKDPISHLLAPSNLPSPAPTTTPVAPPAQTEDKLRKGDDLKPEEVKKKASFKALNDVWVRYQSDAKPVTLLILRKDKFLVIKAKEHLVFDTLNPESLLIKTRANSDFVNLSEKSIEINSEGEAIPNSTGIKNGPTIPEKTPNSPQIVN